MKGTPPPSGNANPYASPPTPQLPDLAGTADSLTAPYGLPFWFTYLGNSALMAAISLLYRYSDYVKVLGGDDIDLGWIVGVGMVGSLLMRLGQGVCIVRIGARQVWFWSVLAFIVVCLAHRLVTTAHGPAIYLLQIGFRTSVAGAFGASITYVSSRVQVFRVAEVIGMLGTSGFIGMLAGTWAGKLILGTGPVERAHVDAMFDFAAWMGVLGCIFAWLATRGEVRPIRRRQPPLGWLLKRYHPGVLLLVAMAVGIGVSLPTAYLRPFTESLGIGGVMLFFWIYAPTAFLTRFLTRRAPERIGIRPMILLGLTALSLSVLLYLIVTTTWLLVIPALLAGFAHAFLFPSVTGGGSTCFPSRYRGIGVTVMLAMFDLGSLIGAPMAAMMLYSARKVGLPEYPSMFIGITALLTAIAVIYFFNSRHHRGPGLQRKPRRKKRTQRVAAARVAAANGAHLATSADNGHWQTAGSERPLLPGREPARPVLEPRANGELTPPRADERSPAPRPDDAKGEAKPDAKTEAGRRVCRN